MPNISSASTIENVQFTEQATAPATPASGFFRVYVSSGSVLRGLDDGGNDFAYSTVADPARKGQNETITGDWIFSNSTVTFKAINVGRVQISSANGTYNDWAPTGYAGCSFFDVVVAGGGNVIITGLSFGQADGRVLFLFNNQAYSGGAVTLKHEHASSSAANRIYTPGSVDYVLGSGYGATLVYNGGRWLIFGKA